MLQRSRTSQALHLNKIVGCVYLFTRSVLLIGFDNAINWISNGVYIVTIF